MPDGGIVKVALIKEVGLSHPEVASKTDSSNNDAVYYCLRVMDRGTGIAEENVEHLFEPFFTTKGVGEGTGLGLSISYGIIKEHNGWIDVSAVSGGGSCFSVYIPVEA